MEFSELNRQLLPFGIVVTCDRCCARKLSAPSREATSPSISAPPSNQTPFSFNGKRIRKRCQLITPAKVKRPPINLKPQKQTRKQSKTDLLVTDKQKAQKEHSPKERIFPAPNNGSNLNFNSPFLSHDPPFIRQLFENTLHTPLKIGEVQFYSGNKYRKMSNFEPKTLFYATAEPRLCLSEDSDSIKDFVFDQPEGGKQRDSAYPFKNIPSCMQSPFVPIKPFFAEGTPDRTINFEKIPKSLDFLENPFFMDF